MQNNGQKFIYHYTSLENAMNIIQPKGLVFWGSRYDCMNDPFDSIYAKDTLLEITGLKEFEINQDNYKDFLDYIPYIVSFSKNRDDALMWRLYNVQICLKILRERIKSNNSSLDRLQCRDCYYMSKKQIKAENKRILKGDNGTRNLWNRIKDESVFIKHPDFRCENEVRVVKFNARINQRCKTDNKYEMRGEIPNDFKYKKVFNSTKIVYYKEFEFDKETLRGIIVRANSESEFADIKEHLEMWLYKCGWDYLSSHFIQQSKRVPVRQF